MNNRFRYIFLPLGVAFVIFVGTCLLAPSRVPRMPQGIPWDKLAHFGLFFVLSAVSLIDYYRLHGGEPKMIRWIFWGFVVPVMYGGGIELLQKYVFTLRSGDWGDFVADVLGSLTAALIAIIYVMRKKKAKKNISL